MPLNELAVAERVVGEREVRRALEKKTLKKLFVALDSDASVIEGLAESAETMGVEVERVDSKLKLGRACAIDRSAAVAGLLRRT
ncbi:MAG: ribosomal L7Ae/L30e/S12e/Gadd45 family protein [Synergistaceae bacterium]|jgi:large subunit ribosomal protein L7A|nr:ribosomal L7Ae/L30e/S12e/Gadd45 family protein [Synergistaceae bacterium]